jgi:hypothetical protein
MTVQEVSTIAQETFRLFYPQKPMGVEEIKSLVENTIGRNVARYEAILFKVQQFIQVDVLISQGLNTCKELVTSVLDERQIVQD